MPCIRSCKIRAYAVYPQEIKTKGLHYNSASVRSHVKAARVAVWTLPPLYSIIAN